MTVEELIKVLSNYPSDAPVILSHDGEGNGFSPCVDHGDQWYDEDYDEILDEEEDGSILVVVLWPAG